jgi:hypothetical protein
MNQDVEKVDFSRGSLLSKQAQKNGMQDQPVCITNSAAVQSWDNSHP